MSVEIQKLRVGWKFLFVMIALLVTMLIDTSFVKINDLINKNFIATSNKILLFSINSTICLILQLVILKFVRDSFGKERSRNTPEIRVFHIVSSTSFCVLVSLIGLLVFQLYYYDYYETWINILIVTISYGTSATLLISLTLLFLRWYKTSHDLVVFLYVLSMSLISFHLVLTALFADAKLSDTQHLVGEYVGGSGDISGGRHQVLDTLYRISSFLAFFSIWMSTAILTNSYRDRSIRSVRYWIILALPMVYFLITAFYQFFLKYLISSYMQNDPVTVSIMISAFLSLSKPVGGLIFAVAFWNMSNTIGYERKMKMSMAIAGWGIFFIFAANQASTQIVIPYPPFGVTTVTVLNVAAFLVVLGIFNSATFVSANNSLRVHIHNSAMKLLNPIGRAEMEREIQKTVKKISEDQERIEISGEESFEFDENELKKYLTDIIKLKKEHASE